MAFNVENGSGAALSIDDLGITLATSEITDLALRGDPAIIAISSQSGNEISNLINSGDLIIKDPIDGTTDLSVSDGLECARSINDPHFNLNDNRVRIAVEDSTISVNDLKSLNQRLWSAGALDSLSVTDGGAGTVDIAAGEGIFHTSASDTSEIVVASWPAVTGLVVPDKTTVNVFVDYNAGSPVVSFTTNIGVGGVNGLDAISLAFVDRDGTVITILPFTTINNSISDIVDRLVDAEGVTHTQGAGSAIIDLGANNIGVTAGSFWLGLIRVTHGAFDTSVSDTFAYWRRDGAGGWIEDALAETDWNDQEYDTDPGLATLSNNRYTNVWIYLQLGTGGTSELHCIYGTSNAKDIAEAGLEDLPGIGTSLPEPLQRMGVLLGRFIIKRGDTFATVVESAFTDTFGGGGGTQNLWETFASDSGTTAADSPTDTFTLSGGVGVTTAIAADAVTITWDGVTLEDEGTGVTNTPHTTLNFVGAGVAVTDAGSGEATITISGGGGGNAYENITGGDGGTATAIGADTITFNGEGINIVATNAGAGLDTIAFDLDISDLGAGTTLALTDEFAVDQAADPNVKFTIQDIVDVIADDDLASVVVSNTISTAIPLVYTNVTWDTTDLENIPGVIEHDNTNTDRILIKETGLYFVQFSMSFDADAGEEQIAAKVVIDDTTDVPASERTASEDDEINDLSNAITAELTAGTYLTFQIIAAGTGNLIHFSSNFSVTRARGTTGATGATGATGSGSTITVQDEGVNVTNTPHDTLNFVGTNIEATDAGGGVATITLTGGELAGVVAQIGVGDGDQALGTGTFDTVGFPTTSFEDDTAVLSHDPVTNNSRITFTEAGNYLVYYSLTLDPPITTATFVSRVIENGVLVAVPGSIRTMAEDAEANDCSNVFMFTATVNEYIEVQVNSDIAGSSVNEGSNFGATRMRGSQGATGADGAPGAGSTIIVQEEGVNVTNTPHDTLNFIGTSVTATDAGAGVTDITITGGVVLTTINGQIVPTFIDTGRSSKVLSVSEMTFVWTDNKTDAGDWLRIGTSDSADVGQLMPMDGTIVRVATVCEDNDGFTMGFDLYVNGVLDTADLTSITGAAGQKTDFDETLDIDFDQGDILHMRGSLTGTGQILDNVTTLYIRWRG